MCNYFATGREANYCNDCVCLCVCVCLSVCPRHISASTRPIFTKFFVRVTHVTALVLLCRLCDTLCTSGFVNDVKFAHNAEMLVGTASQHDSAASPVSAAAQHAFHALFARWVLVVFFRPK